MGDEEELTKGLEKAATEEENQEHVMSWKSRGGGKCLAGGSDQQKPRDESFPRKKEFFALSHEADGPSTMRTKIDHCKNIISNARLLKILDKLWWSGKKGTKYGCSGFRNKWEE